MKDLEKAREWARYAENALTEMGRLNALMAALHDGRRVLELTLQEIGLSTIQDVLEWAWKAKNADNSWRRHG